MKVISKITISLLLCFLLISVKGYSQSYSNVVKANPIGLALGNFNVTYEKMISQSSSFLVSGSYAYKLLGSDVNTFGIGAGYRYYFTHAKTPIPSGFWVTPKVGFELGSVKDNGTNHSISAFSIGAELGYQWAFQNGFVIDLGIGPNFTTIKTDDSATLDKLSGILPSMTLSIGYAF